MKSITLKRLLGLVALLGISSLTMATDGYFSLGYGTVNKGLAGAGTGYYQASLVGGNPAGSVFNESQLNVAVALFNPNRQYTITGNPSMQPGTFGLTPGTIESDTKYMFIPSLLTTGK